VIGRIVYVLQNGLKGEMHRRGIGHKTLYNRFVRWSKKGVFAKILQKLSKEESKILMVDATHLKVHKTAARLKRGGLRRKLHAVCDGLWRPVELLPSARTVWNGNGIVGAGKQSKGLVEASYPQADEGYGADWFRKG
jgi:transposase